MLGNFTESEYGDVDMALTTNLEGRVRNLRLPKSKALMPLFEAVVNAVQSIEDNQSNDGVISIDIYRTDDKIMSFLIRDNGIGFNDDNLESFRTLDSNYKRARGCHGVGRLLWLKTFEGVEIESVYKSNNETIKLTFDFNIEEGDHNVQTTIVSDVKQTGSSVLLYGFLEEYRVAAPKDGGVIARSLLEHLFYYFISGIAPKIVVNDDGNKYDLDDLYEDLIKNSIHREEISIRENIFSLVHGKIRGKVKDSNVYGLLAASRLVKEKNITSKMISGLPKKLEDEQGEFTYICYVESDYLNQNVNVERTGFTLVESGEDLFNELTMQDIEKAILAVSKKFLEPYIKDNVQSIRNRLERFVESCQPKYKPILKYLKDEDYPDNADISDNDLELVLHRAYQKLEKSILKETQENLKPAEQETYEEFQRRTQQLLEKITDIKQSDLASYVLRRKLVLEYLEKSLLADENGKYKKEALVHNLIIPMGIESDDLVEDESNLWLIDERLAFHNYLASDKKISSMAICPDNDSRKEPDLLSLKVFNNPVLINNDSSVAMASISVVEFKRPMRDDMSEGEDKNPIEQTLLYVKRIRNGTVKTKDGRLIPENQNIPAFCYVIADLTPTMKERCELASLRITSDGLGYFGYNSTYNAYIEVISFDKLLSSAKERNQAFFNKLGLSVSK